MKFPKGIYIILGTLLICLSGCVVQSRQLNSFIEVIRNSGTDLLENSWSLRYLDYESVVYAVSTPEGVLFSNQEGDQILFDGWTITQIRGIGRRQVKIDIYNDGKVRNFKIGNRLVSRHNCNTWEKQENSNVIRFFQVCSGKQKYDNSILVQGNGDISLIRQIVDERYTSLSLTKLH